MSHIGYLRQWYHNRRLLTKITELIEDHLFFARYYHGINYEMRVDFYTRARRKEYLELACSSAEGILNSLH